MRMSCESCLQKMCLLIDSVAEIWKLFIQTQDLSHNGCSIQRDKIEVGIQESELVSTEDFCERSETTPLSSPKKELKTEGYNTIQNYSKMLAIIFLTSYKLFFLATLININSKLDVGRYLP